MILAVAAPPQGAGETAHCRRCDETKPRADFHTNSNGNAYTYCRPCRSVITKKRNLAKLSPEILRARVERVERQQRERDARAAAKAHAKAQRMATRDTEQAVRTKQQKWRENRKRGLHGNGQRKLLPPDQIAANRERVDYLLLLITDSHPTERIADEHSWQRAYSQMNQLWLQSGDRTCVCCGETVPPERMHPPTPGNTRPSMCMSCAVADYEGGCRATLGSLPGPRLLPMRDGTFISVAELARRHSARSRPAPEIHNTLA